MIEIPLWLFWLWGGGLCMEVLSGQDTPYWHKLINVPIGLAILFIFARGWPGGI